MALKHRRGKQSPGWLQAVVFNTIMLFTPFLAANAVSGLFASQTFAQEPGIEAMLATRERLDTAFAEIVPRSVNRRAYWADLVDHALRENNLPAARGFLISAPQMLDHQDAKAIGAAARDDPFGSEDQKLLRAAILFLPNDVRARFERTLQPMAFVPEPARRPTAPEDLLGQGPGSRGEVRNTSADVTALPRAQPRPDNHSPQFSLLGTYNDLTRHSRRWVRDADDPGIELRLTGFGLLVPDLPAEVLGDLSAEDAARAASVLRSALRANRLQPNFVERLERALDAALPAPDLRLRLAESLDNPDRPGGRAASVEQAFRDTLSTTALDRLLRDFQQVSAIAETTSSVSAVALIEHVGDDHDLRRLRTVVEAGDERATALETRIGADIIDIARTGVAISRYTVMQAVALAGALLLLFWQAANTAQREWRRRYASSAYG
ncbi:MAG: hypothetical protein AAF253_12275 [Pseudomonadota bacterium]